MAAVAPAPGSPPTVELNSCSSKVVVETPPAYPTSARSELRSTTTSSSPAGRCGQESDGGEELPDKRDSVESFFEAYLQCLLQLVVGQDYEAAQTAWLEMISADFVCMTPHLSIACAECVLSDWRVGLQSQHYSGIWISDLKLGSLDNDCKECQATLTRTYTGHCGQDLMRDLLRLQVLARRGSDGKMRVSRHSYVPTAPKAIDSVLAQSQICQDFWVLDRLAALKSGGFFLEIGANHSEELSNSYLLEKAKDWRGVCIEPFPSGDWSTRSVALVKCAVGPEGGRLQFIAPGHVLGGLVEEADVARVMSTVPVAHQQVVEVETRDMTSILNSARVDDKEVPKVIHYMSLDTEGSEYSILCDFPFETYTVLAITVEHNFREPARSQIRDLLEKKGFVLDMSVEHDDFFLLKGYEKFVVQQE